MVNHIISKRLLTFPIMLYFAFVIISSWLNYDGYTIYTTVFFMVPIVLLYIHYVLEKKNILSYFLIFIIILIYSRQLIYNINLLREIASNDVILERTIFDIAFALYIVCYLGVDFLQTLQNKFIVKK